MLFWDLSICHNLVQAKTKSILFPSAKYHDFPKVSILTLTCRSHAVFPGLPRDLKGILKNGTMHFRSFLLSYRCVVTGAAFYAGCLTPILVIVVANLVVTGFIINFLRKRAQVDKDRNVRGLTMASIVAACSVLMGTTWVIGLFAVEVLTLEIQIAFCVLNSLQGFFIFLFYGVRNSDVRERWKWMSGWWSSEDSKNSDSVDSKQRLVSQTEKVNSSSMTNMRSGAMTKAIADTATTEKSATLTTFIAQPSTSKRKFWPASSRASSVPDNGKERCKTNSVHSKRRRTTHTRKHDFPIIGSLAVTAMSGTLPSFVAKPSTHGGQFPESERDGLQANESVESSISTKVSQTRSSIGTKLAQPVSSIGIKLAQPGVSITNQLAQPRSSINPELALPRSSNGTKLVPPGSNISTKLSQLGSTISTELAQPGPSSSSKLERRPSSMSKKLAQPASGISKKLGQQRSSISTKMSQPGSTISTKLVQSGPSISSKLAQPGSSISTKLEQQRSSINIKLAPPISSKQTDNKDLKGVGKYSGRKNINPQDENFE